MAEREGFEPSRVLSPTRFRDGRTRPSYATSPKQAHQNKHTKVNQMYFHGSTGSPEAQFKISTKIHKQKNHL